MLYLFALFFVSQSKNIMNPQEQKSTVSEAVRKHKEFLFPAVTTYYQEPLALVRGEGEYVWDDQATSISTPLAAC